MSIALFIYSIFSKIRKGNNFQMIIDDRKNNVNSANQAGFIFKVKFVFYTILSMISVAFLILECFKVRKFTEKFKYF